jgi:hypothetical protein
VADIKFYETQALLAAMTHDGSVAVITFKPHGEPPVAIQVPRESLVRFLTQASEALGIKPPRGGKA